MNAFLRALSGSQQVAALFLLVFGVLSLASAALLLVSLRERDDGAFKAAYGSDPTDLRRLLRHTWVMAATFWLGWTRSRRCKWRYTCTALPLTNWWAMASGRWV